MTENNEQTDYRLPGAAVGGVGTTLGSAIVHRNLREKKRDRLIREAESLAGGSTPDWRKGKTSWEQMKKHINNNLKAVKKLREATSIPTGLPSKKFMLGSALIGSGLGAAGGHYLNKYLTKEAQSESEESKFQPLGAIGVPAASVGGGLGARLAMGPVKYFGKGLQERAKTPQGAAETQKVHDFMMNKYPHLRDVKIRETSRGGSGDYGHAYIPKMKKGFLSDLAKRGLGFDPSEAPSVLRPNKNATFFAHELGHASADKGKLMSLIRFAPMMRQLAPLAGAATLMHDDTRDYAPLVGMGMTAPLLYEEARASKRALPALRQALSKGDYRKSLASLGSAFGTYALNTAGLGAGLYGVNKLLD